MHILSYKRNSVHACNCPLEVHPLLEDRGAGVRRAAYANMSRELGTVQWHAAGGGSQSSRNYNGNQQNNQNWQGPAGWTPEMDQGLREPWTEEEFRAAEAEDRRQGHCAADYEDCYSSVCLSLIHI